MEVLRIDIDDTYCEVIKFGNGNKTLLILPGVSLCSLSNQAEAIEKSYEMFKDDFSCFLINYRNKPSKGYSFEDISEDIYSICMKLGIRSAYVYGVSMGGMVGQYIANKYQGYIHSLVICSSMCRITPKMIEVGKKWIRLARSHDVIGLNTYFFERCYSKEYLKNFENVMDQLLRQGSKDDCDRFAILVEAIMSFDIKDCLKNIHIDALVIGDINDNVIGFDGSREIADELKCELYTYGKYSHAVYDEASDIKKIVYDFMMRNYD